MDQQKVMEHRCFCNCDTLGNFTLLNELRLHTSTCVIWKCTVCMPGYNRQHVGVITGRFRACQGRFFFPLFAPLFRELYNFCIYIYHSCKWEICVIHAGKLIIRTHKNKIKALGWEKRNLKNLCAIEKKRVWNLGYVYGQESSSETLRSNQNFLILNSNKVFLLPI